MQDNTGTSFYYTLDYNQSVIQVTDTTQTAVAAYTYDPFGKITNGSGNGVGTQAAANPWRYATGYQTSANGLIKLGARYYNPTTGRFTQTDPSGQETNNYTYTNNNPVTYNDPQGTNWFTSGVLGSIAGWVVTVTCTAGGLWH